MKKIIYRNKEFRLFSSFDNDIDEAERIARDGYDIDTNLKDDMDYKRMKSRFDLDEYLESKNQQMGQNA